MQLFIKTGIDLLENHVMVDPNEPARWVSDTLKHDLFYLTLITNGEQKVSNLSY